MWTRNFSEVSHAQRSSPLLALSTIRSCRSPCFRSALCRVRMAGIWDATLTHIGSLFLSGRRQEIRPQPAWTPTINLLTCLTITHPADIFFCSTKHSKEKKHYAPKQSHLCRCPLIYFTAVNSNTFLFLPSNYWSLFLTWPNSELTLEPINLSWTGVAQSVQCLTTDWTAGVRSPTETEDFSSNHCVQTGSGAHPAPPYNGYRG
jgi:hypothetical protein